MTIKKPRLDYQFHPFELAFCGHSNSGKTTLIEKLVQTWAASQMSVAYLKHDSHHFEMDQPGKDTHRIRSQGASLVIINDRDKLALTKVQGTPSLCRSLVLDADVLVIEGYKDLPIPKIVVLDSDLSILKRLPDGEDLKQLVYVGPWQDPPVPLSRPYFQRDDIAGINALIHSHWQMAATKRPFYGLILAGGRSSRMGQDKALLQYHDGKTQIQRCHELLADVCDQVFLSVRGDQTQQSGYQCVPSLVDRYLDMGPLGGILSALHTYPHASFLVLAVDLPGIDKHTLSRLVANRNLFRFATCYLSSDARFPEPLCAIYEPKCFGKILQDLPQGLKCPTEFLRSARIEALTQPEASLALFNANHPTDRNFYLHARA